MSRIEQPPNPMSKAKEAIAEAHLLLMACDLNKVAISERLGCIASHFEQHEAEQQRVADLVKALREHSNVMLQDPKTGKGITIGQILNDYEKA